MALATALCSILIVTCAGALASKDDVLLEGEFDFVVIGAGSGGSVMASRLSEIGNWNVLLLEAGVEGNFFTHIPALAPALQFTSYSWGFLTEQQEGACLGLKNRQCAWPCGRGLGGSSLINYMLYVRGNAFDYDLWQRSGCPGWSYDQVLPYFRKSESFQQAGAPDRRYHGSSGYLAVSEAPFKTRSGEVFLQACRETGYPLGDYNAGNQFSAAFLQSTTLKGRRHSGYDAFLRPALGRANLKISTNSRVVRLDMQQRRAVGVYYWQDKRLKYARARKEVILCAGALHTPQLLMLAGVGPKSHLAELGIDLLADLPVGDHLVDHLNFPGAVFTLNESIAFDKGATLSPLSLVKWLWDGSGPMGSLGGVEAVAFPRRGAEPRPRVELLFVPASVEADGGLISRRTLRFPDHLYNTVWKPLEQTPVWSTVVVLLHPRSEGRVRLRSKNPLQRPIFYGGIFAHPGDVEDMLEGVRETQKLSATRAFQRYGSRLHDTPLPGCEHRPFDSDDYWRCAIRLVASSIYHQAGTCRMGPPGNGSVVDEGGRVHGLQGLRVADASVIPVTISGHLNAVVYMLAEKIADAVKGDWLAAD